MDPFIIGIWVEKIQLEPETFPRMAGVENMTAGSPGPLPGDSKDSRIFWVTTAKETAPRVCAGSLVVSPPGSRCPQELHLKSSGSQELWPTTERTSRKPGMADSRQVGMSTRSMHTDLLLLLLFLRADLYQNCPGWPVTSAMISPGSGPGAPSQ